MQLTIRDFKSRMDVLLTLDHEEEFVLLARISKKLIKTPEDLSEEFPEGINVNIDRCFRYSKEQLMKQTLARLKWLMRITDEKVYFSNNLMDYTPSQKEDLVNILLDYQ